MNKKRQVELFLIRNQEKWTIGKVKSQIACSEILILITKAKVIPIANSKNRNRKVYIIEGLALDNFERHS